MKQSILDEVPGIGPEAKMELLKRFGSVDRVVAASDEELRGVLSEEQVQGLREKT